MSSRPNGPALTLGLALVGCVAGCVGFVDEPAGGGPNGPGPNRPGTGPTGTVEPQPATRAARLSHAQWENTVEALLGLDASTGLSVGFRADASSGGYLFDHHSTSLEVDEALWVAYAAAAEALGERAVTEPAIFDRIVPSGADDAARRDAFITELGRRAHRRPLDDVEEAEYRALFDAGAALFPEHDALHAGVRLVVAAMLQSPHFLYRVERSGDEVDGLVPLDGYEIASRLSYFLWGSMPDEALFAAAASGGLSDPEGIATEARRMLADARAEETVARFHHHVLEVERFLGAHPAEAFYPDAPANLGELAVEENERFLHEMVFGRDASWTDILTSTETFVNQDTAPLYGLSGAYGPEFELAELDPATRRGIFTQLGFLVGNATGAQPDPIHRGVFLARTIACVELGAPPDDVPPLPPVAGMSNRATVEGHTESPGSTCASCHSTVINPFGFPYESYDSTGAYRTEDNGFPVDTTSSPLIDDRATPVASAVELAEALAASPGVHGCYAEHWVEYAFGRPSVRGDTALIRELGAASAAGELSVLELIVAIVRSRAFLNRSIEELDG